MSLKLHQSTAHDTDETSSGGSAKEANERQAVLITDELRRTSMAYQYNHRPSVGFRVNPDDVDRIVLQAFRDGLAAAETSPTTKRAIRGAVNRGLEARNQRLADFRADLNTYSTDAENYGINLSSPISGATAIRAELFDNPAYRLEFPACERFHRMTTFRPLAMQRLANQALGQYLDGIGSPVESVADIIPTPDKQAIVIRGMLVARIAQSHGEKIDPLYIGPEGLDTITTILEAEPISPVSLVTGLKLEADVQVQVAEMLQDFQTQLAQRLASWKKFQERKNLTPDTTDYWEAIKSILDGVPIMPLMPEREIVMVPEGIAAAMQEGRPHLWQDGIDFEGYTIPNPAMIDRSLRLLTMGGNRSDSGAIETLKRGRRVWEDYERSVGIFQNVGLYEGKLAETTQELAALGTPEAPDPTKPDELKHLQQAHYSITQRLALKRRCLAQNDRDLELLGRSGFLPTNRLEDSPTYHRVLQTLLESRMEGLERQISRQNTRNNFLEWGDLYDFQRSENPETYTRALDIVDQINSRLEAVMITDKPTVIEEIFQVSRQEILASLNKNVAEYRIYLGGKGKSDDTRRQELILLEYIQHSAELGVGLSHAQLAWLQLKIDVYGIRLSEERDKLARLNMYSHLREQIGTSTQVVLPQNIHDEAIQELNIRAVRAFPPELLASVKVEDLKSARALYFSSLPIRASGMQFTMTGRDQLAEALADKKTRLTYHRTKISKATRQSPREDFVDQFTGQLQNPVLGLENAEGLSMGQYLAALGDRIATINALLTIDEDAKSVAPLEERIASLKKGGRVQLLQKEAARYQDIVTFCLQEEEKTRKVLLAKMQELGLAVIIS